MIDKLKPKYLETSKDGRSKSSEELIDALNITVTGNDDGGQGVIKNIKGTEAVLMSLPGNEMPSGTNICIGSVKDEALGVVYFFVYNSEENHGVYAYSAKTNTYRLIFMDASLNFKENGFVKADILRMKKMDNELDSLANSGGLPEAFDPCGIPEFINDMGELDEMLILAFQSLLPENIDINEVIALQGTQCNVG